MSLRAFPIHFLFVAVAMAALCTPIAQAHDEESDAKSSEEVDRSFRKIIFQFDDDRSLTGYLLDVAHFDILIEGYNVKIPLQAVQSVRFDPKFGSGCSISSY